MPSLSSSFLFWRGRHRRRSSSRPEPEKAVDKHSKGGDPVPELINPAEFLPELKQKAPKKVESKQQQQHKESKREEPKTDQHQEVLERKLIINRDTRAAVGRVPHIYRFPPVKECVVHAGEVELCRTAPVVEELCRPTAPTTGAPGADDGMIFFGELDEICRDDEKAHQPFFVRIGLYYRCNDSLLPCLLKNREKEAEQRYRNEISAGQAAAAHQGGAGGDSNHLMMPPDQWQEDCGKRFEETLVSGGRYLAHLLRNQKCFGEEQLLSDTLLRDLLLLGNQIPFKLLIKNLETPLADLVPWALHLFSMVHLFRSTPPPPFVPPTISPHPVNLLHLFHLSLVKPSSSSPCHQMHPRRPQNQMAQPVEWVPSAKEMVEEYRISLVAKPIDNKVSSFLDIDFDLRHGVMRIPPLLIKPHTYSVLKNLIIFEIYHSKDCGEGSYVAAYSKFMNHILRTEEDAKILLSRGIIVDRTNGTDRDIAQFPSELLKLPTALLPQAPPLLGEENYLQPVYDEVAEHRSNYLSSWRAAAPKVYERNQWLVSAAMLTVSLLHLFWSLFAYFHLFRSTKSTPACAPR